MASRKLEDLHPLMRPLAEAFIARLRDRGVEVIVTCTYRSNAEQDALYAQGRGQKGQIVTYLKGGESTHNFTIDGKPASKAFDVVPMKNGKCLWNVMAPEWQEVGAVARSLGIAWGGDWVRFKDYPHLELRDE